LVDELLQLRSDAEKERKRVKEGQIQAEEREGVLWKSPDWVEAWRPPGYKTRTEIELEEFVKKQQKEFEEMAKKSAMHKEFIKTLKGQSFEFLCVLWFF
jgi:hypothetical protein